MSSVNVRVQVCNAQYEFPLTIQRNAKIGMIGSCGSSQI